jgi:hypothetical protein
MRRAGAPDPIPIPTGRIAAPSPDSPLRAIHEYPGAAGIGTDFQAVSRIMRQRLGKGIGNAGEHRGPANLYGFVREPQPILVLHQAAKHRYF